jgi:hypothetical protein
VILSGVPLPPPVSPAVVVPIAAAALAAIVIVAVAALMLVGLMLTPVIAGFSDSVIALEGAGVTVRVTDAVLPRSTMTAVGFTLSVGAPGAAGFGVTVKALVAE